MLLDELIKEEKHEDDESTETEEDEDRLVS